MLTTRTPKPLNVEGIPPAARFLKTVCGRGWDEVTGTCQKILSCNNACHLLCRLYVKENKKDARGRIEESY
jgi:hypothetical protein